MTVHVRARDMRVHFDSTESMHIPATEESVNMLLTELSSRKGERRRKKLQHACSHLFREMLTPEDKGKVRWQSHSWQVLWENEAGDRMTSQKGLRVRDTGEPSRDIKAGRKALHLARAFWNSLSGYAGEPYGAS